MKKVLVTGYKAFELGIFNQKHDGIPIIKKAIKDKLKPMVEDGLKLVVVSGQIGIDMWAAEVTLELKEEYPELMLAIITPFLEHEGNWNDTNKEYYFNIVSQADIVKTVSEMTYKAPWQFKKHNEAVIRNTEGMILIYDDENEGTPKYILKEAESYAENNEYPIVRINSYDLQDVADEILQEVWEKFDQ